MKEAVKKVIFHRLFGSYALYLMHCCTVVQLFTAQSMPSRQSEQHPAQTHRTVPSLWRTAGTGSRRILHSCSTSMDGEGRCFESVGRGVPFSMSRFKLFAKERSRSRYELGFDLFVDGSRPGVADRYGNDAADKVAFADYRNRNADMVRGAVRDV